MLRGLLLVVVKGPVLQVLSATAWQPLHYKCVPWCRLLRSRHCTVRQSLSTPLCSLHSSKFKHNVCVDVKPAFKRFYGLTAVLLVGKVNMWSWR